MNGARKTCLGAALAVTALCASGRVSSARRADAVDLDVSACPGVSYDELRHLLSVEVAGRPASEAFSRDSSGETPRIVVECASRGSGSVANLSIVDVATGRTTSKPTDLTDVPAAHRSRVLAIAIVELMSEPKAEEAPLPKTKASPPANALPVLREASAVDSSGTERATLPWRFDVAAVALHSSGLDQLLWGGLAKVSRLVLSWLVAAIDATAVGNSVPVSLGAAKVLLVSASAALLARVHLRTVEWNSGLGFRGGVARLSGTPAARLAASVESGAVTGFWGGPFVITSLAAAAGRHLSCPQLAIEGGYSPARVTGGVDGVTQVVIAQWWTNLSLGLGWSE